MPEEENWKTEEGAGVKKVSTRGGREGVKTKPHGGEFREKRADHPSMMLV
jgi:hypothetical protein